jgi:hypothetical protein
MKTLFVRVWSTGTIETMRYQRLCELTVGHGTTEIRFRNAFETYAPNKEKIKAQGHITLSHEELTKRFGCDVAKLSQPDLLAMFSYVPLIYYLDVFEKRTRHSISKPWTTRTTIASRRTPSRK